MGEQKGEILFSGVRPTKAFLKRYTGEALSGLHSRHTREGVAALVRLSSLQKRPPCWG